jgi:hypothetical protein
MQSLTFFPLTSGPLVAERNLRALKRRCIPGMEDLPAADSLAHQFIQLNNARKLRLARLTFVVARIADRVRNLQRLHAKASIRDKDTALTESQRSYLARMKGRRTLRSHTRSLNILNHLL